MRTFFYVGGFNLCHGAVRVVRTEEEGADVNMATSLSAAGPEPRSPEAFA